jgi:hypothetical protein
MLSEWDLDLPSPHKWTLKISTSKIPTEREDRLIQNGQTDHLRLQVAVKRGTLLSGEAKDDKVHQDSVQNQDFWNVKRSLLLRSCLMSQYSKWVARLRSDWAAKKKWGARPEY